MVQAIQLLKKTNSVCMAHNPVRGTGKSPEKRKQIQFVATQLYRNGKHSHYGNRCRAVYPCTTLVEKEKLIMRWDKIVKDVEEIQEELGISSFSEAFAIWYNAELLCDEDEPEK